MISKLIPAIVVAAFAVAVCLVVAPDSYFARVVCLALLAASMGQAWNVVGGLANQISLGHAAFFGIGAYTSTLLQTKLQLSPWIGLPCGKLLAADAACLLSAPTMKLRGPYFALASLAFAECCRVIATSASSLTGGPQGVSVPFVGDSLEMMQFKAAGDFIPIFTGLFLAGTLVFVILSTGRLGYLMRAVREDELAAEVAGVNSIAVKLIGAAISAALMAACGTMYAQLNFFIDPDAVFSGSAVSIRAALIAIVGGVGTLYGPLLGAVTIVALEEVLSAYLSSAPPGLGPFVFGVILVLVVIVRPKGLHSLLPTLSLRGLSLNRRAPREA